MATLHSVRHGVKPHAQARAVSCPACGSTYCRRSVRHSFKDFLRRLAGWFPWHIAGNAEINFIGRNDPRAKDHLPQITGRS